MKTLERIHKNSLRTADILKLIGPPHPHSLSIFIPTHRTGDQVLHQRDAKTLDGIVREVEAALKAKGKWEASIEQPLERIQELVSDREFWRHRTEGLALYANTSMLLTADLPYRMDPEFRISDTFYLPPLAPVFSSMGSYYLLVLELENVRLYEANRDSFQTMPLEGKIPERLEATVGFDFEQKSLQHRSQQRLQGGSTSHGHDEADRDRKNEILRYFREIDKGLSPVLRKDPKPLMIASQSYLAALFREASAYESIADKVLTTNLSEATEAELHRKSWGMMTPFFENEMLLKWQRFEALHGTGKASAQLSVILPAAYDGKIDSLFIAERSDVRGYYDTKQRKTTLVDQPDIFTESLVNLAMRETLNNGGVVYARSPEDMPQENQGLAALFRY